MRFERKVALLMALVIVPYACAVVGLMYYIHGHPGEPVSRWISVPLLFLLVLTILGGGVFLSRAAKKQAKSETIEEGRLRRARAIKGLKVGLVVWSLILLNDLRMLAEGAVPWTVAIVGLAVVTSLIIAFWVSLRRLHKAEMAAAQPDKSGEQRK